MTCYSPILITKNLDKQIFPNGLLVPCLKCLACKEETAKEYTLRYCHERREKRYAKLAFLTLTYNNENLPISPDFHMTLRKKDIVDYLKRTREQLRRTSKKVGQNLLKYCYYLSGEYGDQTHRPHYHIVLSYNSKRVLNEFVRQWEEQKGMVNCQERATIQSIYYTIGYVDKKLAIYGVGKGREKLFRKFTRGMGRDYLLKNAEKINRKMYCNLSKFKIGIPRYYKKKLKDLGLWTEDRETSERIMRRKREEDEKLHKAYYDKYVNKEAYAYDFVEIGHTLTYKQYERLKGKLSDIENLHIRVYDNKVKLFKLQYVKKDIDTYKNELIRQKKLEYEKKASLRKSKAKIDYNPL